MRPCWWLRHRHSRRRPPAGVAATRVVRRTPSKFVLPATVAIPKLPATQELAIADAPPELEGGAVPGRVPVAYRVVCQAVQVSGEIQEAKLLVMIHPLYPRLALSARIQGAVRVAAIIDKDGKIAELKVVEGNPFLIDAALESIQKWRHRSTFLTGEPVEVATQIIVHFRLNN